MPTASELLYDVPYKRVAGLVSEKKKASPPGWEAFIQTLKQRGAGGKPLKAR